MRHDRDLDRESYRSDPDCTRRTRPAVPTIGERFHAETGMPRYGDWTSARIGGGGYQVDVVPHPVDPDRLYVWTDVGGLWRSDDAGDAWERVRGGDSPTELRFDPKATDRAYGIFDQSRVRVSTDGGATWADHSEGLTLGDPDFTEPTRTSSTSGWPTTATSGRRTATTASRSDAASVRPRWRTGLADRDVVGSSTPDRERCRSTPAGLYRHSPSPRPCRRDSSTSSGSPTP